MRAPAERHRDDRLRTQHGPIPLLTELTDLFPTTVLQRYRPYRGSASRTRAGLRSHPAPPAPRPHPPIPPKSQPVRGKGCQPLQKIVDAVHQPGPRGVDVFRSSGTLSGCRPLWSVHSGGIADAQPPATICEPSGFGLSRDRYPIVICAIPPIRNFRRALPGPSSPGPKFPTAQPRTPIPHPPTPRLRLR